MDIPTTAETVNPGISVEIKIANGIFVKSQHVEMQGVVLTQHVHRYDHLSMIAFGSARLWKGDELVGDFFAPAGILIKAGVAHTFQTLEPDTLIYCIHNIGEADAVETLD